MYVASLKRLPSGRDIVAILLKASFEEGIAALWLTRTQPSGFWLGIHESTSYDGGSLRSPCFLLS